ncbi:MAG: Zn-ribbon domain-containing OB-fold protein [Anaerolineales bacterium]|jgi:uncharacterized OB-fold protein
MEQTTITAAAFREQLAAGHLMGTECTNCGEQYLPPRPMCTACYGDEMNWVEMGPEGELAAFTTVYIAPTAMIEAGYGRDNPYCSGIVKLDNGLSVSAQILGVDAADAESIKIGSRVVVEFIARGEGMEKETFLAFRIVK